MLLADFFFGCNVPFVIVESDYFRNFIRRLNPNYNIPTRKTLSNSILDRRYETFLNSVRKEETTDAVLLMDGWKNSSANTKNVVSMLRIRDDKYVFLESFNFSGRRETAVNLNEAVNRSINIARERYNANIYAVTTDNASNMMAMGRMTDLWHTTCNSHSGNLLCKAMVDLPFSQRVNALLKEFKSPDLEHLLVDAGGNRIVLAGDTRWCSYRDCYRRLLRNVNLMRLIVNNGAVIRAENREFLFDDNLEAILQDSLLMLDPVCELIRNCEQTSKNIADATEYWLNLNLPAINEQHEILIENRLIKVINGHGLAANFLHPIYQGRRFADSVENLNTMDTFFRQNLTANGLVELDNYRNRTGWFRLLFDRNYQSWKTFWKAAEHFYPELSKLALKLHNICASTGELERLFSQWAYVHDPKRNRLTPERSAKLACLYYELRMKDDVQHAHYNDVYD